MSERIPNTALLAENERLRAIYDAALTLCHNATDECRPDGEVLVSGSDLQKLNDVLDVVEEAESDEGGVRANTVQISAELYAFLMGEGSLEGVWFGDLQKGLPGAFWWRGLLRCAAGWPASAIEARRAATAETGAVHESAAPKADAQGPTP